MSLSGVEIIVNSSGSYMQLRKAYVTTDLIRNATYKAGGAYLFSNLRGCDGQRVYFNGCSAVALNGEIIARGKQFSLQEVVSAIFSFFPVLFSSTIIKHIAIPPKNPVISFHKRIFYRTGKSPHSIQLFI